jgi:hypothetical protein
MPDAPSETETPQPTDDKPDDAGKAPEDEVAKWKALARENEKRAKANADAAKKLAEIEDANKSEIEKATAAAAEATKSAEDAALRALRLEVAADKAPDHLTAKEVLNLAKRLHGSTKEELEADADEFFRDIPAKPGAKVPTRPKPPGGSKDDGAGEPNGKERAAAALRQMKSTR